MVKYLNKYGNYKLNKQQQKYDTVSVAISSAVTAYGRIHISKIK